MIQSLPNFILKYLSQYLSEIERYHLKYVSIKLYTIFKTSFPKKKYFVKYWISLGQIKDIPYFSWYSKQKKKWGLHYAVKYGNESVVDYFRKLNFPFRKETFNFLSSVNVETFEKYIFLKRPKSFFFQLLARNENVNLFLYCLKNEILTFDIRHLNEWSHLCKGIILNNNLSFLKFLISWLRLYQVFETFEMYFSRYYIPCRFLSFWAGYFGDKEKFKFLLENHYFCRKSIFQGAILNKQKDFIQNLPNSNLISIFFEV